MECLSGGEEGAKQRQLGEASIATANNRVHLCNRRLDCGFNANHWRGESGASP